MGTIEESEEVKHAKAKEQAEAYYKDGMQALAEGNLRPRGTETVPARVAGPLVAAVSQDTGLRPGV